MKVTDFNHSDINCYYYTKDDRNSLKSSVLNRNVLVRDDSPRVSDFLLIPPLKLFCWSQHTNLCKYPSVIITRHDCQRTKDQKVPFFLLFIKKIHQSPQWNELNPVNQKKLWLLLLSLDVTESILRPRRWLITHYKSFNGLNRHGNRNCLSTPIIIINKVIPILLLIYLVRMIHEYYLRLCIIQESV